MLVSSPTAARSSDAVPLRVLIAFLVIFGVGLRAIVGLPHLPDASPPNGSKSLANPLQYRSPSYLSASGSTGWIG